MGNCYYLQMTTSGTTRSRIVQARTTAGGNIGTFTPSKCYILLDCNHSPCDSFLLPVYPQNSKSKYTAIILYRISSNRGPGVYFLRDSADPAFKRGRRLNGAGVYLLHVFLAYAHPRYVAHAEVEIHFSSCDHMPNQRGDRHTQ